MASTKKRKKRKEMANAIQVPDVIFGTLVHDDVATITGEQGIIFLHSKTEGGKVYSLPPGITVDIDMFDQDVDIIVRDVTNEVILQMGEDDIYEEDLSRDDRLMAVDSTVDLEEIYNERKIQLFTKMAGLFSTFIGGCALSGVAYWLTFREFPFPILLYVCMAVGVLLGVLFGLVPCFRILRRLSSKWVVDAANNYVNMETGKTNLNGGMTLPVEKG